MRVAGQLDRNGRALTRKRMGGVGSGRKKNAACRSEKHNVCAMIICPCECHQVKEEPRERNAR